MRFTWMVLLPLVAMAQGTTPKATLSDYPVHTMEGSIGLGAEYMVHSFSLGEATYLAKDYLVVEVALFPPKGETVEIKYSDFTLKINGRKIGLFPQAPTMVASSLTHPEWRTDPHVEAVGSIGDRQVVYGAPPPPRIPGNSDPRATPPSIPRVPRDNPGGIEPSAPVKPEEIVVNAA